MGAEPNSVLYPSEFKVGEPKLGRNGHLAILPFSLTLRIIHKRLLPLSCAGLTKVDSFPKPGP